VRLQGAGDGGMTHFDVAALEKLGPGEAKSVKLLRGLCFNIIEIRSNLLCCLSAEDGEWTEGRGLAGYGKQYRVLMKLALRIAEGCTEDSEWLVFELMTEAAREQRQPELLPW